MASSFRYGGHRREGRRGAAGGVQRHNTPLNRWYWARRGDTWMMLDETGNVWPEVSEYMDLMD